MDDGTKSELIWGELSAQKVLNALAHYKSCRDIAERIRAACENNDNGMEDALKAIQAEGQLDPLTVLILALGEARVGYRIKEARKSGAQKKHAIHTEPDKTTVREWWDKWQADPSLYKNKAAFDAALSDKTGKTLRTIGKWRLEIQKRYTSC
ncbi:MAG: hypothetical protein KUL86_01575 [Castellaniella sp.]|nr:hypothetical protein [Castellaniella sp.]